MRRPATFSSLDLGGASTQIAFECTTCPTDNTTTTSAAATTTTTSAAAHPQTPDVVDGTASNSSHQVEHLHQVTLYSRSYAVFAKSFLCYGVNEALRRYRAMLIRVSTAGGRSNEAGSM